MNEIQNVIEPSEKIQWQGRPKYSAFIFSSLFGSIFVGVIIGIMAGAFLKSIIIGLISALILFLLVFIISCLSYSVTYYAITNKRIIFQSGIIGRDFKSVDYDQIQNTSVNVGLIGIIFKTGNVRLFTGEMQSTGGKHASIQPKYDILSNIETPYDVLKLVQTHLSRRKENLYSGNQ